MGPGNGNRVMRHLIKAGCLIDGTGASARENVDILFDQRRILEIGNRDTINASDATVIPAFEMVVLPGLIDAHVHICFDASCNPVFNVKHEPPPDMMIRGVRNARDMLHAGVTTIRTLGTPDDLDLHLRDGIRQGLIPGPRIVAAGRSITVTGGHGHYYRIEADGPEEMREATRLQIRSGVNVIKITVTGGIMTPRVRPGVSKFDLDEIRAVVHEAHKAGLKVAAHAENPEGVNDALAAGVDSIEHGYFMQNTEGLDRLLDTGAYLVPTLMAYDLIASGLEQGVPPEAAQKAKAALEYNTAGFRAALDAGASIAMGSDAGTAFNDHGRSWREASFMVRNGMRPMDAIVAATRNGADLLGLGSQTGTVEPGKIADLVVVDGDPLSDISSLGNVVCTIQGGRAAMRDGL